MIFLTLRIGSWTYSVFEYATGFVQICCDHPTFKSASAEREVMDREHFFDGWLPRMVKLLNAK